MKSKRSLNKNNNHFPHLPEEEINKLVEEMTDPNLSPLFSKNWRCRRGIIIDKGAKKKVKGREN